MKKIKHRAMFRLTKEVNRPESIGELVGIKGNWIVICKEVECTKCKSVHMVPDAIGQYIGEGRIRRFI